MTSPKYIFIELFIILVVLEPELSQMVKVTEEVENHRGEGERKWKAMGGVGEWYL